MAERNAIEYLRSGGATNDEVDDFLDWSMDLCLTEGGDGDGKRRRYTCYRLWAKLLRLRRAPYGPKTRFVYDDRLKDYLRKLTGGDVVDADDYAGAVAPSSECFVKT